MVSSAKSVAWLIFCTLFMIGRPALAERQVLSLVSEALGEAREVWVKLPDGYEATDKSYPVLYVLDAFSHFDLLANLESYLNQTGRIPKSIIVGIPIVISDNIVRDRIRDLSPTYVDVPEAERISRPWQRSGEAHKFKDFLSDEVIPLIEERFRTHPFRVLFGHSQGGLFAINLLLSGDETFQSLVAASPSLWWDDGVMIDRLVNTPTGSINTGFLAISLAGEDSAQTTQNVRRFATILDLVAPDTLDWEFDVFEGETHSSVPLLSYYNGLMHTFSIWPLPEFREEEGREGILAHLDLLSGTYGFDVTYSGSRINSLGYSRLWKGDVAAAVDLFEYNIERFPGSANFHDSLGEGLLAAGRTEEARAAYAKALELDPELESAQRALERMQNE